MKLLSVYLKYPQCLNKMKNIWGQLSWARFKTVDLEAWGAPPHKGKDTQKIRLHNRKTPVAAVKGVYQAFFYSWSFLRGLPRRCLPAKITTRWCYRPPSKNLTAHLNSQFCPKTPLYMSKLGLNIILLISNMYGCFFLSRAGLVVTTCMLDKDLMVISTLPRCKN